MWHSEKKAILDTALKMAAKGLVEGTAGNISMRLPVTDGNPLMAITPSSLPYEQLVPDDMMIVDFSGKIMEGIHRPSIETPLHSAIYRARPDVKAIVHAHPTFCSIAAVTGIDIPAVLDEQVIYLGKEIKIAGHAFPGTIELAQSVTGSLGNNNAVIMANHGAVSVGKNLQQAFINCEIMEKAARVFIYSRLIGKVNLLDSVTVKKELDLLHHSEDK